MDLTELDSSCNNEMTSSALRLVMEISINKLRNFQNTLQSPVGQPMKSAAAAAAENRNISLSNNNSNNNNAESMPRVTARRTSSTFSPSNRLYRIMVILKIAKKARSILLTQEAMNTLPNTNVNNDNNNNSSNNVINNHDTSPSERISSTSHSDSGEQCNLLNPVKSTAPLPMNPSSEMPVLHSINPNEQRYKRISDHSSDDSSVTSNKRVFDSSLSIWTPENPVLCNPESQTMNNQEEQLRKSHDDNNDNMVYNSPSFENDNGIRMEDENTADEVDTEGADENDEDDDDNDDDDEDDDGEEEGADSTPIYPDQYSLNRCRMSIVQQADIHSLENNRTASSESLRSSGNTLQQVPHTMDYNEMNHDCGRDMCICLSNSANSRPLITGII